MGICFLPAEVNKIQVAETERFHGSEVMLPKGDMKGLDEGPTTVKVKLTPKALAAVTVHVFEMPSKMPPAEEIDGAIDWAAQERSALPGAVVEVMALKDAATPWKLPHAGNGVFVAEDAGLPEGFVSLQAKCAGYESEEKAVMLLVGLNEFYLP